MNPYLAKLRARDQEARHPEEPSKPSKPIVPVVTYADTTQDMDFEGFEGDRARRFSGNEGATKAIGQISLDRLGRVFEYLESGCPDHVPADHWQQAVEDGSRFLAQWGERAEALGWTAHDLFGLAPIPDKPHPSYRRLSRYDETGLIWLLRGQQVLALTESAAAVATPTGAVTVYRRRNKPALGTLGDSLDDFR